MKLNHIRPRDKEILHSGDIHQMLEKFCNYNVFLYSIYFKDWIFFPDKSDWRCNLFVSQSRSDHMSDKPTIPWFSCILKSADVSWLTFQVFFYSAVDKKEQKLGLQRVTGLWWVSHTFGKYRTSSSPSFLSFSLLPFLSAVGHFLWGMKVNEGSLEVNERLIALVLTGARLTASPGLRVCSRRKLLLKFSSKWRSKTTLHLFSADENTHTCTHMLYPSVWSSCSSHCIQWRPTVLAL